MEKSSAFAASLNSYDDDALICTFERLMVASPTHVSLTRNGML
jgi:hypothetical protein